MKPSLAAALTLGSLSLLAGAAGCVSIDGGSVEVAWTVFAADGRGVITDCACADPPIAFVQLKLGGPPENPAQADPCAGNTACRFACGRHDGITPFFIPPGPYLMSIEPLTADGMAIAGDMVPDPLVGQVTKGLSHDLGAFAIQAPCAMRCHGNDPTTACGP